MAYSANNPPRQVLGLGFMGNGMWIYESTDAHGTVEGANYFTNGGRLGMKVGDLLANVTTDTSGVTWHRVTSVSATSFTSAGPASVSAAVLA